MAKVMAEVKRPMPLRGGGRWRSFAVGVDYLRHLSPAWHGSLRPTLWAALALATAVRSPFYDRWDVEHRAAPRFLAALAFMLAVFLCEAIFVRFVRLHHARFQWHREADEILKICNVIVSPDEQSWPEGYSCRNHQV